MRYTFEWDPNKATGNLQKHKVSFERAAEIFRDPIAISIFDEEHSADEERWITMGKDNHNVVLVVVHTFAEVANDEWTIRTISTWKATKNEIKQYENHEIRDMRKEYDFSKGERGKFYRPDVELNVPVYLEPDVAKFVREFAKAKNVDVESIVNDWLRQDIALISERIAQQSTG